MRRLQKISDLFDFVHNEKNEPQLLQTQTDIYTLNFSELYWTHPDEAKSLQEYPEEWLDNFKAVYLTPSSYDGRPWQVRIVNFVESMDIRAIESSHIGQLIQVETIVVTATIPEATITVAVYECPACQGFIDVPQDGYELTPPDKCIYPGCTNRRGFKLRPEKCTYTDIQLLSLQERPEELPPGEIPEPLTTVLRGDLIRCASPGDRVKVVGIIAVKRAKRSSLDYTKILEANSVDVLNRNNIESRLTEERIQQIRAFSQQPDLEEKLITSYCPSIYGWRHIKKAILRCIFGGVDKDKQGSFVRGWLNCLLTGDPGIAKTAMLLFGKNVCQRGIYDTGRGVTGVGLTAALVKQDEKFILAAGTLALGDRGNVFLDEFEKMNKEDREVIHVPMENGIITVSKGGLKAQLNSRCSILAAMNPVDGRYNSFKTLLANLRRKPEDFPDSLVSRFDLIFIMVDDAKASMDTAVANRMLGLEQVNKRDYIPIDLLRDYISYTKHINPIISTEIKERIRGYYEEKRQEMRKDISKIFTPRQLESIERLIEARARMHLRTEATMEDLEDSLWLHEIYVNETWKDPYTKEVDTGPMMGITETSLQKQAEYVPRIIESMYTDGRGDIDATGERCVKKGALVDELIARSNGNIGRERAQDVIRLAIEKDYIWNPTVDKIKLSGVGRNQMLGAESETLNTR